MSDILRTGVHDLLRGVVVTPSALAESTVRLFPESRHRSRRVRKKLLKRFGSEFKLVPCAYDTPYGLIIHPALYDELKRRLAT